MWQWSGRAAVLRSATVRYCGDREARCLLPAPRLAYVAPWTISRLGRGMTVGSQQGGSGYSRTARRIDTSLRGARYRSSVGTYPTAPPPRLAPARAAAAQPGLERSQIAARPALRRNPPIPPWRYGPCRKICAPGYHDGSVPSARSQNWCLSARRPALPGGRSVNSRVERGELSTRSPERGAPTVSDTNPLSPPDPALTLCRFK